jgi:hypothetical protein
VCDDLDFDSLLVEERRGEERREGTLLFTRPPGFIVVAVILGLFLSIWLRNPAISIHVASVEDARTRRDVFGN